VAGLAAPDLRLGILGATSLVGTKLLSRLASTGQQETREVHAFSRQAGRSSKSEVWHQLGQADSSPGKPVIPFWLSLAPIWVLPDYFDFLLTKGARRIVALSSTSRFTKADAKDPADRQLANKLAAAEEELASWAESNGIDWIILRPTMIYGGGHDQNISRIARLIHRFGFFPVFGPAQGRRQPVHVDDVAKACLAALETSSTKNMAMNISGAEVLSYTEMVSRVFRAMNRSPRIVRIPAVVFKAALVVSGLIPGFRKLSFGMIERMNQDLVFDHQQASEALDFTPRKFVLGRDDLPR